MGLVNAECDLDSCEEGMNYIREDNSQLQLGAKDAITSVQNLLATVKVVITGMIFVAALAAGCKLLYFFLPLGRCLLVLTRLLTAVRSWSL